MLENLFYAMRPKHWIKNLFIFIPLIFGKKAFSCPENIYVSAGFAVFCLASSAAYLINDIIDLRKDRINPVKRLRPIAAGKISVALAISSGVALGFAAIASGFALKHDFGLIIALYLAFNVLYSYALKGAVIIDVFCLAGFFLLRIAAGTILSGVEFSYWMIFMTVLLALFLGFNKRRQEIRMLKSRASDHRDVLAEYGMYFIDQMISVVTSSIVVVYMLYTVDARTVTFFGTRHLYYTVPFVYYGVFRYLYLVHKRFSHGDPTTILFSDRMTQLNLVLWVIVCVGIIYFGL
jgi:4-hydroxybenzoate polyprenyltransferase